VRAECPERCLCESRPTVVTAALESGRAAATGERMRLLMSCEPSRVSGRGIQEDLFFSFPNSPSYPLHSPIRLSAVPKS
jgi:hypothetical protein